MRIRSLAPEQLRVARVASSTLVSVSFVDTNRLVRRVFEPESTGISTGRAHFRPYVDGITSLRDDPPRGFARTHATQGMKGCERGV
jgi:hypothetical protein